MFITALVTLCTPPNVCTFMYSQVMSQVRGGVLHANYKVHDKANSAELWRQLQPRTQPGKRLKRDVYVLQYHYNITRVDVANHGGRTSVFRTSVDQLNQLNHQTKRNARVRTRLWGTVAQLFLDSKMSTSYSDGLGTDEATEHVFQSNRRKL